MFSFIKKWRQQRLRKKITLLYLSNPYTFKDKNAYDQMFEINLLCENIYVPYRSKGLVKMLEEDFYIPNKKTKKNKQ